MDSVEIHTHVIDTIQANQGAVNSLVFVDRQIGMVDLGGDVVDTTVVSGVDQNYTSILNNISGQGSIFSSSPTAPPVPANAQPGGQITAHVAGDIMNSVFAASVQPFEGNYSSPNALVPPSA
ncbi:MAG: hypothetical protein U0835_06515 [Isosphaeraceae bacterium]